MSGDPDFQPLRHKCMPLSNKNTLPLRREKSSGSIVLCGNHLCESVDVVNKPLSLLSSDHLCQEKQNTFLYYVRKQVMFVVHNVNRTIRIDKAKPKYGFFQPNQ